jgi:hypothetical protein
MIWIVVFVVAVVVATAVYDLTQRQHAILRTFPIVGHFRYLLEAVGSELRQYIVTDNNEERPFSRCIQAQRYHTNHCRPALPAITRGSYEAWIQ